MSYCPECGVEFDAHAAHSQPEAEEVVGAELADAAVQVAEIEANRDVTIARIEAKADEAHDETEVEALKREIAGMREALALVAPQPPVAEPEPAPEPEPIVVEDKPEIEAPPAEHEHHSEPKPKAKGLGMWG